MKIHTYVVMQIICSCIDYISRTILLLCGSYVYSDTGTAYVLHRATQYGFCYRYQGVTDPYPELGDCRIGTSVNSLKYSEIRRIVHLYQMVYPTDLPNTVDALSFAHGCGIIHQGQLDEFLYRWRRTC